MTNPIDPKDIINQLSDGLTTLNFNLKDWTEILNIAIENGAVYELPEEERSAWDVIAEIRGLLNNINKARN